MKKVDIDRNPLPETLTLRVLESPVQVDATAWNALLALQSEPSPFMRHEYLAAMHTSGSATPKTGWTPRFMTLWQGDGDDAVLQAACPLYLKDHSYGEYVFDFAWANAYQQHGLPYYPKALIAVPFTPVPGSRLLARDEASRAVLVDAVIAWCDSEKLSSLHLLFGSDVDIAACAQAGLMTRNTVQFHWKNVAPTLATSCAALPPEGERFALGRPGGETSTPTLATSCAALPPSQSTTLALPVRGERFARAGEASVSTDGRPGGETRFHDFDDFLATLAQDKRKKIRQERRKVSEAGVTFRWALGADITPADWDFFYRCYERTYLEHGNAPYLSRAFFKSMARDMPENWLLFTAERQVNGSSKPIATSLIAVRADSTRADGTFDTNSPPAAYGRYWGALERVDCLHFEACYYQPLQWCIDHGYSRFEGGAQGEHKMARALMPVHTTSAHWLAHPAFADAVQRFLEREGDGIDSYLEHLEGRSPFKAA